MSDDTEVTKPSGWKRPLTLPVWGLVLIVGGALVVGVAAGGGSKKSGGGSDNSDEIAALDRKNDRLQAQLDARPEETATEREERLAAEQVERDRQAAEAAAQAAEAQAQADFIANAEKNTVTGDGIYEIGVDINPGRWRTPGGSGCYYAILNSPDTSDIETNNIGDGPMIADLPAGKFFDTTRCGGWTHD